MEEGLVARLRQWLTTPEHDASGRAAEELALAALLVQMMRADYASSAGERATICRVLARRFGLSDEQARRLLAEGERAADRAVSLFEHTRPLDVALSEDDKFAVIAALWETAFADGELDANEDYLAHKLAELLHVRHGDLMRIKDEVRRRHAARSR